MHVVNVMVTRAGHILGKRQTKKATRCGTHKKLDSSPKIRTDQITIRQNSEQVANNALAQTGRTAKICQTIIQFKIRLGVVNVYFPTTPNIKSVDDGIYETFVQTNKTKKTIRTMKSPVTVVLIVGICATKSSVS